MSKANKPQYKLGTQNMLDLAGENARKIPFDTIFVNNSLHTPTPKFVVRESEADEAEYDLNNSDSVSFLNANTLDFVAYFSIQQILPIVK